MLLTPNEDQAQFGGSVAQVLGDRYDLPRRAALVRSETGFSAENWAIFAELGWLGALFSEASGGFGDGLTEVLLMFEELGAALALEPLLDCALLPGQVLAEIGGASAQGAIAGLIDGARRLVLVAPSIGGASALTATAVGDGAWRLAGHAPVVRWAEAADALLVHARGQEGADVLFLLPAEAAGVIRRDMRLVDGARASDLTLDIVVASDSLVGAGPQVSAAVARARDTATLAICAEAMGAMDRCVWITRDYLKIRRQFGQPLSQFQALQHRLADMVIELELARAQLRRCAWTALAGPPEDRSRAVSACKVTVGKAGAFITAQAIQLHGGIGVTDEYVVGHYYKRVMAIGAQLGDADHHRRRFAAV